MYVAPCQTDNIADAQGAIAREQESLLHGRTGRTFRCNEFFQFVNLQELALTFGAVDAVGCCNMRERVFGKIVVAHSPVQHGTKHRDIPCGGGHGNRSVCPCLVIVPQEIHESHAIVLVKHPDGNIATELECSFPYGIDTPYHRVLTVVLQPSCIAVKQLRQLNAATQCRVGNAFFIIGKFDDAVSLNLVRQSHVVLVHGTACRVNLRNEIKFEKLISTFPVAVNIQIDRLVSVLQLLEADTDRLFRLDNFLGSGHGDMFLLIIRFELFVLISSMACGNHFHISFHRLGCHPKHTTDSAYVSASSEQ